MEQYNVIEGVTEIFTEQYKSKSREDLLQIAVRVSTQLVLERYWQENKKVDGQVRFDSCTLELSPAGMLDLVGRLTKDRADLLLHAIEAPAIERRQTALQGAEAKKQNSPVQAIKKEVYRRWQRWQAGEHPRYRGSAEFVRHMQKDFPKLNSGTAENWCGNWIKGKKLPE